MGRGCPRHATICGSVSRSSSTSAPLASHFGGQKANEILAQSAADVAEGWQYLPFQVYANSIFNDSVGQAYVGKSTLVDGLKAWQTASLDYGEQQGFTVSK